MVDAEVIIVGAGPAGLCAALELSYAGIEVLICDAQSLPIDKPCGEGIMPEGVKHLERLGVMSHLDPQHFSTILGVSFINAQGFEAKSSFAPGFALGLRRLALSKALYEKALQQKNITFLKSRIIGIKHEHKYMSVESEGACLKSRFIIGADGLRSSVRRFAKLELKERVYKRYGMRQHFRIKPWSDYVEVYFSTGLEAYVTPCGFEQTNVAFLWDKSFFPKPDYAYFLTFFPKLHERLKNSEPISQEKATGPFEHRCSEPIGEGVALLGDASGYLDAITGEGTSMAMSAALALKHTILKSPSLGHKVLSKEDLNSYAYAHKIITQHYYRNTHIMLKIARYPKLMAQLIEVASRYPRIFSWIINKMRSYPKIGS